MQIDIDETNNRLASLNVSQILDWCYATFSSGRIKLSTNFGPGGLVLLDMLSEKRLKPNLFTIDTGRIYQETYDLWEALTERYGIWIETFFPEAGDLENLVTEKGPNSFYSSVMDRKECCYIRKIKPLKRALESADLWITGLRRDQTSERKEMGLFSYSDEYRVYKVNPLFNWREHDVWEYIIHNGLSYNKLHDKGFSSIGCVPCTRALKDNENIRAGRWWWEEDIAKECGIHIAANKRSRDNGPVNWNI